MTLNTISKDRVKKKLENLIIIENKKSTLYNKYLNAYFR